VSTLELICVGLSHHTAPLELRERAALPPLLRRELRAQLKEENGEVLVLDTCNRLEVYAVSQDAESYATKVRSELQRLAGPEAAQALYERRGEAMATHLFRVAASLDSMVLGEPQILGQLKDALAEAREDGAARGELTRICSAAFASAKRVRNETAVGRMATSMASVAVELARKVFGSLEDKTVLMIGAGEMGKLAARSFVSAGIAKALVASRTQERAEELANEVGAQAFTLEKLPELIVQADVVVCSTASPTPIVTMDLMHSCLKPRKHRPLFLLDLAVPRDVEPEVSTLDGVYVFDLDDVQRAQSEGIQARAAHAQEAEQIVAEEVAHWAERRAEREGKPVLAQLRLRAESIAKAEAEKTLAQLGGVLDERQRKSVEAMAMAIVNKLLHAPTTRLRAVREEEGQELADAAAQLFALNEEPPIRRGGKG
jgi:glutamyl-tRNA reductase